jgi:hypothetical protein
VAEARVMLEIGGVRTEEDGHLIEVIGPNRRPSPQLPPPLTPSVGSESR